jgi:Tol biopolymer transport system component
VRRASTSRAVIPVVVCVAAVLAPAGASRPQAGEITWVAYGVFAARADGSGARQLVPGVADQHYDPAWSPGGRTLVFSGRNSDQADLYVYDAATATHRVLDVRGRWASPRRRTFSYLLEASWAPDGQQLAVADHWSTSESTVKILALDERRLRPVTRPRPLRSDSQPAWAPDGRTIALVRRIWARWVPTIVLVRTDGSGLRTLTRGTSPSWSPNARRLVFAWGHAIYRVDADGRNRVRLARGLRLLGDELQPRWSPDGRKILYVAGPRAIVVMDADGTDRVRVRLPRTEAIGGAGWRP